MKRNLVSYCLFLFAAQIATAEPRLPKNFSTDHEPDGQEIGNGGDVIFCPSGTKEPGYQLLDYWEGNIAFDFSLQFPAPPTDDAFALAQLIVERWQRFPLFQELIAAKIDAFRDEAKFIPGMKLSDVPDSLNIGLPTGCTLIQAAVQREPEFPRQKRYQFDKDLWDAMAQNPWQRAGLILHEIFYTLDIQGNKASNSRATRYINAMLSSADWQDLPNDFVVEAIEATYFDDVGELGELKWIKIAELLYYHTKFHANGNLHKGILELRYPQYSKDFVFGGHTIDSFESINLEYNEQGAVVNILGNSPTNWDKVYQFPSTNGVEISTNLQEEHEFDGHGQLLSGRLITPTVFRGYEGSDIVVAKYTYYRFFPNGDIRGLGTDGFENYEIAQPSVGGQIYFLRMNYDSPRRDHLRFHPGNIVKELTLNKYSPGRFLKTKIPLFGGTSPLASPGLRFHDNGVPMLLRLEEVAALHTTKGEIESFAADGLTLAIDAYGRVIIR